MFGRIPLLICCKVMNLRYEGRWWASYSERGTPRSAQWQDFGLLIFAGTAQDALNLSGLRDNLAPQQLQAMRGVRDLAERG